MPISHQNAIKQVATAETFEDKTDETVLINHIFQTYDSGVRLKFSAYLKEAKYVNKLPSPIWLLQIISTDDDPSLRIENFARINL